MIISNSFSAKDLKITTKMLKIGYKYRITSKPVLTKDFNNLNEKMETFKFESWNYFRYLASTR
jgi:hypothetical protein